MTGRPSLVVSAVASMVALALACSDPSSSADGGVDSTVACDDYFDAIVGIACNDTIPPPTELDRIRPLFHTVCQNALGLPGNGLTAPGLEACAKALVASGCGIARLDVPECVFLGSLPDGAACNDAPQCQSGDCKFAGTGLADGGATNDQCGKCTEDIAAGEPCTSASKCASGSVCDRAGNGFACTPVAYGGVGDKCDGLAAACNTGLYCDVPTAQCTAPGPAGAPCAQSVACNMPLVCTGVTGTAHTCQDPAGDGAPCQVDQDCGVGLGCASATHRCTAVTWVAQGQTCTDVARCLVGNCPITPGLGTPGGSCPTVIADGQPCRRGDPSQTCDTFSVCASGTCQQPDVAPCQ